MDQKIILLIEDNPDDEALMLRALQRNTTRNEVVAARDGVVYMFDSLTTV